jgi:hypothetical protein
MSAPVLAFRNRQAPRTGLTADERELVACYRQMNQSQRAVVLEFANRCAPEAARTEADDRRERRGRRQPARNIGKPASDIGADLSRPGA